MRCLSCSLSTLALLFGLLVSVESKAAIVVFSVDQASSSLTLGGNVDITGTGVFDFAGQPDASTLQAGYSGTITVEVDDLLNPTSLSILSSDLIAEVTGDYAPSDALDPDDSSPGNYGVTIPDIQAVAKFRELTFDLSAPSTVVSSGDFAVSGQTFEVSTGQIDAFAPALGGGTDPVSGSGANTATGTGSYSVNGSLISLTLPAEFSFEFQIDETPVIVVNTEFTGSFSATSVVPEPSSLGLLGLPVFGLVLARGRRLREGSADH